MMLAHIGCDVCLCCMCRFMSDVCIGPSVIRYISVGQATPVSMLYNLKSSFRVAWPGVQQAGADSMHHDRCSCLVPSHMTSTSVNRLLCGCKVGGCIGNLSFFIHGGNPSFFILRIPNDEWQQNCNVVQPPLGHLLCAHLSLGWHWGSPAPPGIPDQWHVPSSMASCRALTNASVRHLLQLKGRECSFYTTSAS
jgi:hypothetical protein